ncbi:MAG: YceI family protein [Saprospiraceae bacterium]|nr:YceI family protein [Saprospiraceae bacterium]MBK8297428.1 YceI family protein [Saprospiraceae bacterium]
MFRIHVVFQLTCIFFLLSACKQNTSVTNPQSNEQGTLHTSSDSFQIDTAQSIIYWMGKSPSGAHNGRLNFKSGILFGGNLQIQSADLLIDMNTIRNLDIEDASDRNKLDEHLKNEDFFNVTQFPDAKLKVDKINEIKDSVNNAMISGTLTIKGVSNPIVVNGKIDYSNDGVLITIPEFLIDRTNYNIMYSSKKILATLKDGFIHDEIALSVKIVAKKI